MLDDGLTLIERNGDMPEYSSLVPDPTKWERAVEQTSGERWLAVDPDIVRRSKDPWACPEHLLNFLAFERSVDIWDEAWDVPKKRAVIASAPADHRIKTTQAGIERYLEIAGAKLLQAVTAPEGFFASPDLTRQEWDAYIALHPKVRITLAEGAGIWLAPEGVFADHAFADVDFVSIDDGPVLRGRRAYLVKDGVETPLQLATVVTSDTVATTTIIERVTVPGHGAAYAFDGEFFADDSFADAWDDPPRSYTYALDRQYVHSESRLELTAVPAGYLPRDTRFVRESLTGAGGPYMFAGDFCEEGFAGDNDGGLLLADVIHLLDPAVSIPHTSGMSFADHNRVGFPAGHAELLVDWQETHIDQTYIVSDHSFAGEDHAAGDDTARRDFLLDAIVSSKKLSDRIGVTFQTMRERTLADGYRLDQSTPLGAPVPNRL